MNSAGPLIGRFFPINNTRVQYDPHLIEAATMQRSLWRANCEVTCRLPAMLSGGQATQPLHCSSVNYDAGIKIAGRNTNNLRYADNTTLMAESKEELKSLLIKVKERVKKLA